MKTSVASKRCRACHEEKPAASFYRHKKTRDGLYTTCRSCHLGHRLVKLDSKICPACEIVFTPRAIHQVYCTKTCNDVWAPRRNKYGISKAEFNELLRSQGFLCAICSQPDPTHVDHCHRTGLIRGILCKKCNSLLGMADDQQAVIQSALDYLRR
jgi:hypothetical protein